MLKNNQLLNVVANAPGDIPVAAEVGGATYPIGAAEVRDGTLVLIAHDGTKPSGKSKPAKPSPASATAAVEGMELK